MEMLRLTNPATGEVFNELPLMPPEEVPAVVTRARAAFAVWSKLPLQERLKALAPLPQLLMDHGQEFGQLVAQEMGRPIREGVTSGDHIAKSCHYALEHAEAWLKPEVQALEGGLTNELHFVPQGVVLAISPWNFPLQLALYGIWPALICGNSVIHKPARQTPLTALKLHELLAPLLPKDALQTVIATSEVTKNIIESHINMVALVGSTAAGKDIMARAAPRLLNLALELGGKDAMIILDDADLPATAKVAVDGSLKNAGQACNAVERIYVPTQLHDQLVELCKAEVTKVVVGDPMDSATTMGPLANADQLSNVEAHVADAVAKGANVIAGGKRLERAGFFYAPTILTNVSERMDIMREETFGPIIAIQAYTNVAEAIRLANDIPLGLTASVWTNNTKRGHEVAEQLEVGNVGINHLCRSHQAAPWGGTKQSGVGRLLGREGLRNFCEMKNVRFTATR